MIACCIESFYKVGHKVHTKENQHRSHHTLYLKGTVHRTLIITEPFNESKVHIVEHEKWKKDVAASDGMEVRGRLPRKLP